MGHWGMLLSVGKDNRVGKGGQGTVGRRWVEGGCCVRKGWSGLVLGAAKGIAGVGCGAFGGRTWGRGVWEASWLLGRRLGHSIGRSVG